MNILLMYMVKVAVYLTAFFLVYSLILSKDTSYGRNRAFVLFSLAFSLILPLISFQTVKPLDIQFFGKLLSEVFITASPNDAINPDSGLTISQPYHGIFSIYIIGATVYLLRLIIDLLNLLFLINHQKTSGSRIIRFHGFNTSGFSAMGYIFISARLSEQEASEIIRHEQTHLRKNHFLDIIFVELVKAVQWFNPVVYLFDRSLREIHEYQADQECLKSGVAVVNYQILLLNQVFQTSSINLSNSFSNPSLVKKRIIMMTKKRTSSLANIKLLIAAPIACLVFFAISAYKEIPDISNQNSDPLAISQTSNSQEIAIKSSPNLLPPSSSTETKDEFRQESIQILPPPEETSELKRNKEKVVEINETPYVEVEEMPVFPGGDEELLKFIGKNTTYPENAKKNGIQGRVIVRFCITEKGDINRIGVLNGVDPELDAEAVRVIKTLPLFKPGRQGGKNVPVWYMVPITFTLK